MFIKTPKTFKNRLWPKKFKTLSKIIVLGVWKSLNDLAAQNKYFKNTLHPKMMHCCEEPRSMLPLLRGIFFLIWRIQIQIYPKTYVELKYSACYLKNKVGAHRSGLVVQLSRRVAPP